MEPLDLAPELFARGEILDSDFLDQNNYSWELDLMYAARYSCYDAAQTLLDHGADIDGITQPKEFGVTALWQAAELGH
ncbi:hypothetical protein CC78DRAFT_576858 [Lojkania enalia]|uniref:Ankyrin repeat protein n=1 Tax=Lojkania enalia TaxID=147567 RepID=A0A9P4KH09_9PLEO|nr:hypothetical protein CC78DRAFT_576858 [Didymosphaeria enalia]